METLEERNRKRKEEMANARKFREQDRKEITEKFKEPYRLGTDTNWSLFNFLLYSHDFRDYSDDMDLLRKFYQRIYPSLVNLQKSNELLKDVVKQNWTTLNRPHKKLLEDVMEKPSPFEMAEAALKEAGDRARARARSGIETYQNKVKLDV